MTTRSSRRELRRLGRLSPEALAAPGLAACHTTSKVRRASRRPCRPARPAGTGRRLCRLGSSGRSAAASVTVLVPDLRQRAAHDHGGRGRRRSTVYLIPFGATCSCCRGRRRAARPRADDPQRLPRLRGRLRRRRATSSLATVSGGALAGELRLTRHDAAARPPAALARMTGRRAGPRDGQPSPRCRAAGVGLRSPLPSAALAGTAIDYRPRVGFTGGRRGRARLPPPVPRSLPVPYERHSEPSAAAQRADAPDA